MAEIKVTIKLFGAFRKYGDCVSVPVAENSSVSVIKEALSAVLDDAAAPLIEDSVLANDDTILPRDFVVGRDTRLSILPPVCGG